jgi:hypothetical protein
VAARFAHHEGVFFQLILLLIVDGHEISIVIDMLRGLILLACAALVRADGLA